VLILISIGYLIRNENKHQGSSTLAISHNISTSRTYGVLTDILESFFPSFISLLLKRKGCAGNPLLIPIITFENRVDANWALNLQHRSHLLEAQEGMKTNHYYGPTPARGTKEFDLVASMSRLTSLVTACAQVTQVCATQERVMQFLWEQLKLLEKSLTGYDKVLAILKEDLAWSSERSKGAGQDNQAIQTGAKAQVQMVKKQTPKIC
jgi:hypothetical protein